MGAARSGRAAARLLAVTCCGISIVGAAPPKPGITAGFPERFRLLLDWHQDGEEAVSEEVHAAGTVRLRENRAQGQTRARRRRGIGTKVKDLGKFYS
jgi:hypothetical protein